MRDLLSGLSTKRHSMHMICEFSWIYHCPILTYLWIISYKYALSSNNTQTLIQKLRKMSVTQLMSKLLQSQYPDPTTTSISINSFCFHYFTVSSSKLFVQYDRIVKLSITHCDLRNLEHFPYLPELEELDLSDNGLQGGLNFIMRLSKLTFLNLTNNRISAVNKLLPLKKLSKCSVCLKGNSVINQVGFKNKMKVHGIKIIKEGKSIIPQNNKEKEQKQKDTAKDQQKNKEKSKEKEKLVQKQRRQKVREQQLELERQIRRQMSQDRKERERIRQRQRQRINRDTRRMQSVFFRHRHDRQLNLQRDLLNRNPRQLSLFEPDNEMSLIRRPVRFMPNSDNYSRIPLPEPSPSQPRTLEQESMGRDSLIHRLHRSEGRFMNSLMRIRRQYQEQDENDRSDALVDKSEQNQVEDEGSALNSEDQQQDVDMGLQEIQSNQNNSSNIQLLNPLVMEMQPPSNRQNPASERANLPSLSNSQSNEEFLNLELNLQQMGSEEVLSSESEGDEDLEERE